MTTEIGFGLDGCVYKPGFCKSTHKYPKREYISKVMKQGREKAELESLRYLNLNLSALDPEMNYFISDPELCALSQSDSFNFEMARNEQECKDIEKPYYAVNYIDGGEDLFIILSGIYSMYENGDYLPLPEWNDFLFAFKNIFEGIKLLNENGIYHMDIKPDNIVYDSSSNPAKFKLIDFGLSRTRANPPINTVGTVKYIPPEMYMFPNKNLGLMDIKSQYNYFFNEVNQAGEIYISDKPSIAYYTELSDEQKYEKADVWALGMTLIDLYNGMIECPNFTDKELEIYGDIPLLAKKMIDPYVHSRITIRNALIEYNKIIFKIDNYFYEMQQAEQGQAEQGQAEQGQAEQQARQVQARQRNRSITNDKPSAKKFKSIIGGISNKKKQTKKKTKNTKSKKSKKIKSKNLS
jgi:serine/threonine protein kinase